MAYKDHVIFENLTTVSAGSLTTSFVAAVTTSLRTVCMLVKNGTNGDVVLSFDGTNAKMGFPASSGTAYDMRTNAPFETQLMLSEGTTVYVKWQGSAPGSPTGNLYIEFMEVTT